MLANYPKLMPSPMCQDGDKNVIPQEISQDKGLFSYKNGFPFINQVAIEAGGKAPERNDFNGIFNEITQHIFYMQCGGQYLWNKELDYQVGALVFGSDKKMYKALQVSGKKQNVGAKDPINTANAAYWELFDTKELIALHNNDQNAHKGLFDAIKGQISATPKISLANVITPSDTTKAVTGKAVADYAAGKDVNNVFTKLNTFNLREVRLKSPELDIITPPGEGEMSTLGAYRIFDKRNNMIGELLYQHTSNNARSVSLTNSFRKHFNPDTGANSQNKYLAARMGLTVDADDYAYGYCPSPKTNQIGDYIATTKWVRDYGQTVKKIGERTTAGDWSLTNVIVGKPIFITVSNPKTEYPRAHYGIKAGSLDAQSTTNLFIVGSSPNVGSNSSFIIIPTITTVIINISHVLDNPILRAYQ